MVLTLLSTFADASQLKDLLFQAIDNGSSSGAITGQMAEQFHRQTGSTASVHVEVTTLKVFEQPGCRRLNARLTMPGVVMTLPSGTEPFEMNMGINLCRDGSPPTEGGR